MKNRWFVAIKRKGADLMDLSNLTIIPTPEGRYMADPFLVDYSDRTFLFYEDYNYIKGRIGVGEVVERDGKIELIDQKVILNQPFHMSFPSVFEAYGTYWMTPERSVSGSLWIYRCERFPDIWSQHRCVATGRFDDPIIRKVPDGFQVWATEENKLVVWQAGSLSSENWNVIMRVDKPYMRNAGHFIGDYPTQVRPTQDCVPVYGRAIRFVDEKNELVGAYINPDWYPDLTGTHTFSTSRHFEALDGRVQLSSEKTLDFSRPR